MQRPIGELIERRVDDDTVRGILLTDALIGTFASAHSPELAQNRCFLYHVIGNGTGEWRVPVGGMGAVASGLERAAVAAGAELRTGAEVVRLEPYDGGVAVRLADDEVIAAGTVLASCAPVTLAGLLGQGGARPEGAQVKINIVLRRLPAFRSGIDPTTGFAGTLHLHQGYAQLQNAYEAAVAGRIPDPLPCESYCHSLTDPSIVAPALRAQGFHTLTIFGLHTPARLFDADHDGVRERVLRAALASLQSVLAEPLTDCIARDAHGDLCIEVMSPQDVEREARLPGGHIFHGDLTWPWLADGEKPTTPAERWGVATTHPSILLCGSGARRGGAVSGLGGHNAAMALLETRACRPRDAGHLPPSARDSRPGVRFASVSPRAPLAQLAEQLTLNQRVGGSIPSRRTIWPSQRLVQRTSRQPVRARTHALPMLFTLDSPPECGFDRPGPLADCGSFAPCRRPASSMVGRGPAGRRSHAP